MKYFSLAIFALILTGIGIFQYGKVENFQYETGRPTILNDRALARQLRAAAIQFPAEETPEELLAEPVAEFQKRITKKPFGIYITPETSPVQPDRFRGFHTGVDVEYDDTTDEVPVFAVEDGRIILSKFVSGYGGVMIIRHTVEGSPLLVLYGHLDPAYMVPVGSRVERGAIIGLLGEGQTEETDGVRKHLHFAILRGEEINARGYVENEEDLTAWYNPLNFYNL